MNAASLIRHLVTGLAAAGTVLFSAHLIAPDAVAAINKAGGDLIEPLVIFLALVAGAVTRLALAKLATLFRLGTGESASPPATGPMLAVIGWMTLAAGVVASLPACSSFEGMPLKATVQIQEGALSYSAKRGVEIEYRPGYGQMPDAYSSK